MENNELEEIVTFNKKDFENVVGIKAIEPDEI